MEELKAKQLEVVLAKADAQAAINSLECVTDKLQQNEAESQASMQQLREELSLSNDASQSLKREVDDLNRLNRELNQNIHELNTLLESAQSKLVVMNNDIELLESQKNEIDQNRILLQEQNKARGAKMEQINIHVASLESQKIEGKLQLFIHMVCFTFW